MAVDHSLDHRSCPQECYCMLAPALEDGALKPYSSHLQQNDCLRQHTPWSGRHTRSPMYHTLEKAASIYQHNRIMTQRQSWDNRVYHRPLLLAKKQTYSAGQLQAKHSGIKAAACMCCRCSRAPPDEPIHSQSSSQLLAEELEVAALLQVRSS